jgi:arylsulfatase A-like enzyme
LGGLSGTVAAESPADVALRERPSILLISIDTLRVDHLGIYGYPRPTDPGLAKLAAQCTVFTEAYTTIPLTVPGHASLMSSRFPRELGVLNNRHNYPAGGEAPPLLAELLRQAGYHTAAVVASGVLTASTGLGRGFETYDEPDPAVRPVRRSADQVNAVATALLEQQRGPLFLFVHYYDPHDPYEFPDRLGELLPADDDLAEILARRGLAKVEYHQVLNQKRGGPVVADGQNVTLHDMVGRYDASVRYAADHAAELIRLWDSTSRGAGSLVIVTSDHGEGLGQHGFWSHGMNLYDEALRIPLLVKWPDGFGAGRRVAATVSILDLAPTVLELAGLPIPEKVRGRALRPLLRTDRPLGHGQVVAQRMRYLHSGRPPGVRNWRFGDGYAVLSGTYKYIQESEASPALFDRSDDPREERNLAGTRPGVEKKLGRFLADWLAAFPDGSASGPVRVDEEREQMLRSLGYVDD